MLSFSIFLCESTPEQTAKVRDAAQKFLDYMNEKYPVDQYRVTHKKTGKSTVVNVPRDVRGDAIVSADRRKELGAIKKAKKELGFHGSVNRQHFEVERLS